MGQVRGGDRTIQNIWAHGFVDCLLSDGSPKLAGYLGKYMQKAMQDERLGGSKAFVCSRNIMRPLSYGSHSAAYYVDQIFSPDRVVAQVREFDTLWLGRCKYTSFLQDTE